MAFKRSGVDSPGSTIFRGETISCEPPPQGGFALQPGTLQMDPTSITTIPLRRSIGTQHFSIHARNIFLATRDRVSLRRTLHQTVRYQSGRRAGGYIDE
jgi:hypothetical protein